jgi:hypothetical protein
VGRGDAGAELGTAAGVLACVVLGAGLAVAECLGDADAVGVRAARLAGIDARV